MKSINPPGLVMPMLQTPAQFFAMNKPVQNPTQYASNVLASAAASYAAYSHQVPPVGVVPSSPTGPPIQRPPGHSPNLHPYQPPGQFPVSTSGISLIC